MDALEKDAIGRSRSTPPAEKLAQALEMMAVGYRLQRAKFEAAHPEASVEVIDRLFAKWLQRDD